MEGGGGEPVCVVEEGRDSSGGVCREIITDTEVPNQNHYEN